MFSDHYSQTFGKDSVSPTQRRAKINGVFASVASRYDIMNDVMSFGMHRLWKHTLIKKLPINKTTRMIDVASGTGDIALKVMQRYPDIPTITMVDPSAPMLEKANERLIDNALIGKGQTIVATSEQLPFPDRSFDLCTISFGLRNATHLHQALSEMRRVLIYGGHFFCLEFSPDILPVLQKPYACYEHIIPIMGGVIAKDSASYRYLVDSIRAFPPSETLRDMMMEAGFSNIKITALSGGLVRIHQGVRL